MRLFADGTPISVPVAPNPALPMLPTTSPSAPQAPQATPATPTIGKGGVAANPALTMAPTPSVSAPQASQSLPIATAMASYQETGDPFSAFAQGMLNAQAAAEKQTIEAQKLAEEKQLAEHQRATEAMRWQQEFDLKKQGVQSQIDARNADTRQMEEYYQEHRAAAEAKGEQPMTRYEFNRYMRSNANASGGPKTSLQPIYATDETGKTVLLQPRDDGTIVQSAMPEGVTVSTGVEKIDAGTHWVLQDKRSGQTVGTIAKENYQEAYDSAAGTADAKADAEKRAALPKTVAQAEDMLSTIDLLVDHPGMPSAVGWQGNLPEWAVAPGGSDAAGFMTVMKKIEGQAFLQAFESLKGGGQITEIEGQKATQAITRLSRNLSEEEFKQAAAELREVIDKGLDRARRGVMVDTQGREVPARPEAETQTPAAQPGTGPRIGMIEDGYRFKGGDPADQSNWELAQ
jgi:hypothetical protein